MARLISFLHFLLTAVRTGRLCLLAFRIYRGNNAVFVSVDLKGEKNQVILEFRIFNQNITYISWWFHQSSEKQNTSSTLSYDVINHKILRDHVVCLIYLFIDFVYNYWRISIIIPHWNNCCKLKHFVVMKQERKLTYFYIFLLCSILSRKGAATTYNLSDVENLHHDLLQNYNKDIRGSIDQTARTPVNVTFFVRSLNSFDQVSGLFSMLGYLETQWADSRMIWTTSSYNGLSYVVFPASAVWTPYMVAANSKSTHALFVGDGLGFVSFTSQGMAWLHGSTQHFQSFCAANVRNFPFDEQVSVKFPFSTIFVWPWITINCRMNSWYKIFTSIHGM